MLKQTSKRIFFAACLLLAGTGATTLSHAEDMPMQRWYTPSHVQAGKLRALAVFDTERSSVLPDTPTTYELGYEIGAPAWSGFFGPAGMPEEARAKLADAFGKAFQTPEWEKLCKERGMAPEFLDADEFRAFAHEQSQFFGAEIPKLLTMER